jgi:hypothetical protein
VRGYQFRPPNVLLSDGLFVSGTRRVPSVRSSIVPARTPDGALNVFQVSLIGSVAGG